MGFCEFCGSGPTCCVCGRGLWDVFSPVTAVVYYRVASEEEAAALAARYPGLDYARADADDLAVA